MNHRPDCVLGIFAKWPRPGQAKTRLSGDPAWSARVAEAFLLDTLDRLAAVTARRVIACSPDDGDGEFAAAAAGRFDLVAQGPGDLGERLGRFVDGALAGGAAAVVVVGTDSPTLPVEYVERALAEQDRDVVLGPAFDGGYYLVGCRSSLSGRRPPLFEAVTWGGPHVLAQTVAALEDPAWRLALLPPWYDVDTPADWAMLSGHLAALRRAGVDPGVPRTQALAREARPPGAP